jgi:signal transduction histidine kinase
MKGRVSHKSRKKNTLVVRDVIIKTIRQLTPIILEHGLPIHNIDESLINPAWMSLRVMTDKVKLSQVIYNLLMNSIKYAKKDRNQFKIVIDIRDKSTNYVIKFRDWGIGIREQYKEDIFKEGFRCPEALNNYIAGSGLGLAISKSIMEELGGNLIISRLADPTEFHLILPKI